MSNSPGFLRLLGGTGLSWPFILLFIVSVGAVLFLNFQRYYNKPLPTEGEQPLYFESGVQYQYRDAPVWVATGALLPSKAPEVRAMRPLYPSFITLCKWLGVFTVKPEIYDVPTGEVPYYGLFDLTRGIHLLIGLNFVLAPAGLWIFLNLCRRFGMEKFSALMATLSAAGAYGFSFWMCQAIPEIFCYFLVAAMLAMVVMGFEAANRSRATGGPLRTVSDLWIWGAIGFIIGIFLLGKELYSFPIFITLILLFRRKWLGFVAFSAVVMLPVLLWNFYMIHIVKAYDPSKYLKTWGFIVWIQRDLLPASFSQKAALIWGNIRYQQVCFVMAFGWWVVLLAIIGLVRSALLPRNDARRLPFLGLAVSAFFGSFFIMFFVSNMILPRIMFIMWPPVFYFAWLGTDWLLTWACRRIRSETFGHYTLRAAQIAAMLTQLYLGANQVGVIRDIHGVLMVW